VKRLIRLDPDVKQTQAEAAKLIGRATVRSPGPLPAPDSPLAAPQELFVEALAGGALGELRRSKRKTLQRGDLAAFAARRQRLKFLSDHLAETAREGGKGGPKEGKRAAKAAGEGTVAPGSGLHAFYASAGAGADAPGEAAAGAAAAEEEE